MIEEDLATRILGTVLALGARASMSMYDRVMSHGTVTRFRIYIPKGELPGVAELMGAKRKAERLSNDR